MNTSTTTKTVTTITDSITDSIANTNANDNAIPSPPLTLDEHLRRAYEGDRDALDAVARELHPRLVWEARRHLRGLDCEADDVVQDLFTSLLEGRIRPPRGRGEEVAHLVRLVGVFARKHARDTRRSRGR
jgi:DNA-directed RNA polymerase specialized sigma24 family protein